MTINKQRVLDEFFELIKIPCPSLGERQVADLLKKKLAELGGKVTEDMQAAKALNGTAGNITSAEQISLGGTTLAGGYISVGDACQFTTGPIRATSLTAGNDNGGSMFGGTVCLEDTGVSQSVQTGIARAGGTLTSECPELPEAPANLSPFPAGLWTPTVI